MNDTLKKLLLGLMLTYTINNYSEEIKINDVANQETKLEQIINYVREGKKTQGVYFNKVVDKGEKIILYFKPETINSKNHERKLQFYNKGLIFVDQGADGKLEAYINLNIPKNNPVTGMPNKRSFFKNDCTFVQKDYLKLINRIYQAIKK